VHIDKMTLTCHEWYPIDSATFQRVISRIDTVSSTEGFQNGMFDIAGIVMPSRGQNNRLSPEGHFQDRYINNK